MKHNTRWIGLLLALVMLTALAVPTASAQESILDQVRARGSLICGVNGGLPGFGYLDPDSGEMLGFDADFCRALAAAVFGEVTADNLVFVQLTAQERFTAVQNRQVDVLFRNATWTVQRDAELGLDFGPVNFYDGQGVMVPRDLGVASLDDMDGASICVLTGTTTELNITEAMEKRGFSYELVKFERPAETIGGLEEGRCDALTSDISQLAGLRSGTADPGRYIILPDVISKEALSAAYIEGDPAWADVVKWTVYATMQAEEYGITQANLDEAMASTEASIQRFLGQGDQASGLLLGLDNDFVVNVIRAVGNYGEIFERNVGINTPLALERGLNALWTDGGLHYPPDWR
ncbi:MAG: amino acid ABC transporter substrate-binding protein [Anaerolineae bacterium]|mgnify:CR=1 FL=1|nr:amino acid ABC transporter substrate-binding protein [Anaerolineae bacterium]